MKHSIIKIFKNLSTMLLLNTFLVMLISAFIFEQTFSYKKIENLDQQRTLIKSLIQIPRNDIELANVMFNGNSNLVMVKIEQLKQFYKWDFVGKFVIYSQDEYLSDLKELKTIMASFIEAGKRYYVKSHKNDTKNKQFLLKQYHKLNTKLDELYIKNVHYNQKKTFIIAQMTLALLFISLITTLWYRKRLQMIADDIINLSSIQPNQQQKVLKTLEADAILLRMKRKNNDSIDKSFIDPVTEVLNHKGLVVMYSQKKNLKEGNFTAVAVIELDNFSKANRIYPQEVTQAILKKVAFSLKLFEQATDVIARTDYNQFTLIISRATAEQCYKELEMIRQSINELKFKLPNGEFVQLSISGGFIIKPNNKMLEDAINQAKIILRFAKEKGGNYIAKQSDIVELKV